MSSVLFESLLNRLFLVTGITILNASEALQSAIKKKMIFEMMQSYFSIIVRKFT